MCKNICITYHTIKIVLHVWIIFANRIFRWCTTIALRGSTTSIRKRGVSEGGGVERTRISFYFALAVSGGLSDERYYENRYGIYVLTVLHFYWISSLAIVNGEFPERSSRKKKKKRSNSSLPSLCFIIYLFTPPFLLRFIGMQGMERNI